MKLRIIYTFFFVLLTCLLMLLFTGYSSGPAFFNSTGYTGAPDDDALTCGSCHNANAFGAVTVTLATTEGEEATYSQINPTSIEVTVAAAMGMPSGYGFQLIAFNMDDTPLDVTYSNLSANMQETVVASNGRKYLEHNAASASNTFTFDFQPNAVTGTQIRFHIAANAVNGAAGNGGDSGSGGLVFTLEEKALAVQLSDFDATRTRGGIELNWATETEEDNDYFAVEYSTNGVDFSTLKTIAGAGTSQERNSYAYMHDTPANGTNYYRLSMVEFSGKTTYSDVLVEKFYTPFGGTIAAYPQPAATQAKISVSAAVEEAGTLSVYDFAGRLIFAKDINIEVGENLIDLDCSQWTPANYVITLCGEQFKDEVLRFVVSR